jgi:hypothetical protein
MGMGEHVLHRSTGVIDGHGLAGMAGFVALLPLYFVTFVVSFLPWSIRKPEEFEPWFLKQKQKGILWYLLVIILRRVSYFILIPNIWRWWPERRRDDLGWYLLMQAALVFAAFSLVRTKLPHYTMPAFPCLALWLALQLGRDGNSFAWFNRRLAAMSVFILALMLGGFSVARNYLLTENLWREVKSSVRPETKIGCFGYVEPSLVWKFRSVSTNLVVLGEVKRVGDFLTNAPPFILVLPTSELTNFPDISGMRFRVRGLDMVKFKNRDLTAIVQP